MKTKEFIKRVEELGFIAYEDDNYWLIKDEYEINVAHVNKIILSQMSTDYMEWDEVYNEDKEKLFDLLIEYAKTPIEDREEEKKFWIQHKFMVSKNLLPVNLAWNKLKDVYRSINLKVDNHIYQAQFTFKEYEEIKKKLNTDLKDFELVEVVDVD